MPRDYDGDGFADIAVFRPATGDWYIWQSSSQTVITYTWGGGDDTPVPADYDGDGLADIAVFRPLTGTWTSGIRARWTGSRTPLAMGRHPRPGRLRWRWFKTSRCFVPRPVPGTSGDRPGRRSSRTRWAARATSRCRPTMTATGLPTCGISPGDWRLVHLATDADGITYTFGVEGIFRCRATTTETGRPTSRCFVLRPARGTSGHRRRGRLYDDVGWWGDIPILKHP